MIPKYEREFMTGWLRRQTSQRLTAETKKHAGKLRGLQQRARVAALKSLGLTTAMQTYAKCQRRLAAAQAQLQAAEASIAARISLEFPGTLSPVAEAEAAIETKTSELTRRSLAQCDWGRRLLELQEEADRAEETVELAALSRRLQPLAAGTTQMVSRTPTPLQRQLGLAS